MSTSPGVPHLRFNRRASEASLASQVSGLADAYTASNIATSEFGLSPNPVFSPNMDVLTLVSSLRTSPQHARPRSAALKGPV